MPHSLLQYGLYTQWFIVIIKPNYFIFCTNIAIVLKNNVFFIVIVLLYNATKKTDIQDIRIQCI